MARKSPKSETARGSVGDGQQLAASMPGVEERSADAEFPGPMSSGRQVGVGSSGSTSGIRLTAGQSWSKGRAHTCASLVLNSAVSEASMFATDPPDRGHHSGPAFSSPGRPDRTASAAG